MNDITVPAAPADVVPLARDPRASTLTLRQLAVLQACRDASEAPSCAVLARGLGLSPVVVCRAVDALRRRGFVRQERHPTDRRKTLVLLTPAARRMFKESA